MKIKLQKGKFVDSILRSPKTIFSTKDIALLWHETDEKKIVNRLKQYVRYGKLIRVRKGLYAKDLSYNRYELAIKINTPSYISFETVLTRSGANFQYYNQIFIASYIKRVIKIEEQVYNFVRLKDYVITNTSGIEYSNNISIACIERAFLDKLYVSKDFYLDNPNALNWEKVLEILPIYNNKRMEKKVMALIKNF
jgi:hypothetical protein